MNALVTRTHIHAETDVCGLGTEITPDKIKFTIETDENEEFGFGVEFEVGFTDEECDEIDWNTIDVFTDAQTLERLKKFLKIFEAELEKDEKEFEIKNVDSVLIVWDVLNSNQFFIAWSGAECEKLGFVKDLLNNMNSRSIAEIAGSGYFSCGAISLQLLIDLDHAKTKMALIKHQELTKKINEIQVY